MLIGIVVLLKPNTKKSNTKRSRMKENLKIGIFTENIKDYRQQGKIDHPLENIVFITIAAVISGAN